MLTVGDRVQYVDLIGEGHRHTHWPKGFMITHGHIGEVIHVDREWMETVFSDGSKLNGMPVRYQVSWRAGWFYKMMQEAYGYQIPDFVTDGCGPVEWAHRLHIVKNPTRGEVKELVDLKKATESILHTASWAHLLKHIQVESPVVQWVRKHYPQDADEGRLPGDTAYVFRKASAYDFITEHYGKTGVESLQQRYALLRDAALNEMAQKLTEEGVETTYARTSNTTVGKEKHMAAIPKRGKPAVAAPVEEAVPEKKKAVRKAPVQSAASHKPIKGRFTGDHVTAVLRETEGNVKAIVKAVKEAFSIDLDGKRIADAPNAGIMKMRAGNLVRGQLRREDRLV
jgi:hypothetical protein